jgi:phosphoribosylformylglycinamidine synthase
MVGLMEDVEKHVRVAFGTAGDLVAILGTTRDELGASEFLRTIRGRDEGPCPDVDLQAEKRLVDLLATLAERRLVASAHDVSDGGLAVALAECAMQGGLGASIALDDAVRKSAQLFGESTGRAIVSFAPENEAAVRALASEKGVPFSAAGWVGGDRLRIEARGNQLIDESLGELTTLWRTAFARALESADVL